MRRRDFVLAAGAASLLRADERPHELKDGMSLYWGDKWDKPFVYPIKTVSGKVLSRGWPIEPREGDSKDHEWHRGFWYGHGDINGADYWREQGREKTSRLIAKAPPKGGRIELAMTPPSGKVMGSIVQEFQTTRRGQSRVCSTLSSSYMPTRVSRLSSEIPTTADSRSASVKPSEKTAEGACATPKG